MSKFKFKIGDKAYKPKGYEFPCTIVSVFKTIEGKVRVVAEMDKYGLLHIFNEDQLEHSTQKIKGIQSIELLNYEGPILKAHRISNDSFVITDEWKNIIATFSKMSFFDFIEGNIFIEDSKNKTWVYPDEHSDAKPDPNTLMAFIEGVKI